MLVGHRINEAEAKLIGWLENTSPRPGTRLPSERTLSDQLGLQHYALNRAMGRLIAKGHVRREGYKLFSTGELQARPSLTCHLIISKNSTHLPGYVGLAKEMGVSLVLHTWLTINEPVGILEKLEVGETEGVIFDAPYVLTDEALAPVTNRFRKRSIPIICMGQPANGLFSVLTDITQSLQLAVEHLLELGHREIGLVTAPPQNPMAAEVLQAWDYLCYKHRLSGSSGRIHLQAGIRLKYEVAEVAAVVANKWTSATAVIVFSPRDCDIQSLRDHLAQQGRRVPDAVSLLLIGNAKTSTATTSTVSSVSFDIGAVQETAFNLLQRAVRRKNMLGLLPPACSLRIQSQFLLRSSTKPPPALQGTKPAASASDHVPTAEPGRPRAPVENIKDFEAHVRNAYPLAARASLSERPRFAPVDLGPYVNRPLKFRRGWLGDLPLKHLPPGPREIHGVPFNILGGASRSECGAVVFHSAVNVVGKTRRLPRRIVLPIGIKTQAVYILHGCGYAKFRQTFAHYRFFNRKTRLEEIPLVSLGEPPPGCSPGAPAPDDAAPNIQDWWSDFPHTDFPPASRMVPILENDDDGAPPRHVFLYTLEWINPRPGTLVTHLEIAVNPELATSLGVLAVTVVKP